MQLKGREAVATVNIMRGIAEAAAIPLKGGTAVFGKDL
jgi:hypothetical protein